MEIFEKVVIKNSIVYDFLGSLFRLNCSGQFEKAKNDPVFGLKCPDDKNTSELTELTRERLTSEMRKLLEKFFDWETSFGLCIIHDIATEGIDTVNGFIDYVKNMPAKELLNQFIYTGFGPEIENSEEFSFDKIMEDEKEMLVFVSKSMLFSPNQKAVLYELISNPEKTKQDYLELLEWHYENNFKEVEKETAELNNTVIETLKNHLRDRGKKYLSNLTSIYNLENGLDNYELIILAVSRFYGTFSGLSAKDAKKELLLILGNSLVDFAAKEEDPLKKSSQLFGTLSEPVKIEILKLCSDKKVTVNHLARNLKISSAEVANHIARLSRCALVKTEVTDEGLKVYSHKQVVIDLISKAIDSAIEG